MKVTSRLVNLTPHEIRVRRSDFGGAGPDPSDLVLPSEGLARVTTTSRQWSGGDVAGVPVYETSYGEVSGLPDWQEPENGVGNVYIVSLLVMQALRARDGALRADVVGPATGPNDGCIRDEQGRIYAVRAFQRI